MIKQLSHTQFSFKPRQRSVNDSFASHKQVKYDSLISTILSKATSTNEIVSLDKCIDNKMASLTELTERTKTKSKPSLKSKAIVMKPLIPKSPLNSLKMTSKINNFRVVSYIKHKIEPRLGEDNNTISSRSLFSNQGLHLRQKKSIPHPSSSNNKTKLKELRKLININVNVFIQSPPNHLLTQESKQCKSLVTVIPSSNHNNDDRQLANMKRKPKNLSKEREKRRISEKKVIAERQNSLEQIKSKIHLLSGTFSEMKHIKTCSYFKGKEINTYHKNNLQTQGRYLLQNSIHSLESYDSESL